MDAFGIFLVAAGVILAVMVIYNIGYLTAERDWRKAWIESLQGKKYD